MELGTIPNIASGARAVSAAYGSNVSVSAQAKVPAIVADDGARATVIRNADHAELSNLQQDTDGGDLAITLTQRLREFSAAVAEAVATYKKLAEEIAAGRFSPNNLRSQTEAVRSAADTPWSQITATALATLSNSESPFPTTGYSAVSHTSADRGMFSLAWLKDGTLQALQSQWNLDPGRVLVLLRDMTRPSGVEQSSQQAVAPARQTVLTQEPENGQ